MTGELPIRVLVVDDHDMVRRGLAILIRAFDDLELIGNAANGAEAVRIVEQHRPHVVLMDMIMPEMDGIEATKLIRQKYPDVQVVALTSAKDEDLLQSMIDAGAAGYLSKNTTINDLVDTIRAVHQRAPA